MITILNVDDKPMNHEVIKLDIEEYMEDHDIDEYTIHKANDGFEAIKMIKRYKPQVVFMDMMMPYMTGAETIRCIRQLDDVNETVMIMVTALHDDETKKQAKDSGANGFITKPFKSEAIHSIFQKYMPQIKPNEDEEFFEDEFIDFGDDDSFADTSYQSDNNTYLQNMEGFNESHKKLPASEFLKQYSEMELDNFLADIKELDQDIEEHIEVLYEDNIANEIEHVNVTLEKYSAFLNCFIEFQELSTSLSLLIRQLHNTEYESFDSKKKIFVSEYIKSILQDLKNWKDNVFVTKDAVDVFYINASLLNSCIQLEDYIKKNR
jgi:two-component system, OmpR family, alkaline phosphatase synthesis response regulator PhoP